MHSCLLSLFLLLITTGSAKHVQTVNTSSASSPHGFRPIEYNSRYTDVLNNLPIPYDFSSSNSRVVNASNSWWISSYIYGSDQHEYLVLAHIMDLTGMTYYRGSILDITDNVYVQYGNYSLDPTVYDNSSNGGFNISINDDFYFGSTLPGNAPKQLRATCNLPEVQFDLTFDLSAPILLNTGIGGFFEFGSARTAEWSMPAGQTTGILVRNNITVSVDSGQSLTWYDRQWNLVTGSVDNANWTWFELHLSDSSAPHQAKKLSIWSYDNDDVGHRQWATSQTPDTVNSVQAIRSVESFGSTWYSTNSHYTYPLNWKVALQDGTILTVNSVLADQEIGAPTTFYTYEGFINVVGTGPSGERIVGYGLVEIVPPTIS